VPPPAEPDAWWATYFDDAFLRIYEPFLDEERTAAEVEAIVELLDLRFDARILDVGCGWGRHALELAKHGYRVTGFDLSPFLLAEAERRSSEAELDIRWVSGDMRELGFSAEFDAVISLFSSLGYFGSDADDLRVLDGMRQALGPDGVLLVETMHRDLVAREFAERDWWTTPSGDVVWVEREFDAVGGSSQETLHWRTPDGQVAEKRHSIRIRCGSEWAALLERAGWRATEWLGGWDLEPFGLKSERLILLARPA
jgi:cyclopropane fatty-acyl-phospholipid synthase-like methyltransferase